MICPKCCCTYAKEVVLFTSVEIECAVCDIRKQWDAMLAAHTGPQYRMPIITDVDDVDDVDVVPLESGASIGGQPDYVVLSPKDYLALKKAF